MGEIVLDLSELSFIDSTGREVFGAAPRRSAWIGCSFILSSPGIAVLKTLCLTGIAGRISIDIGDAVL